MPLPDQNYLEHILDECLFLSSVQAEGPLELEDDPFVSRAVVRSLEIIGEASRQLSSELKERLSDIPWHMIVGMRNRLIHEYFGVDYEIVYSVIREEIPVLIRTVQHYLKSNPSS